MRTKIVPNVAAALDGIPDGATVLVGGFGLAGQPIALIDGLLEVGTKDLTIVANNAGNGDTGLTVCVHAVLYVFFIFCLGRIIQFICIPMIIALLMLMKATRALYYQMAKSLE